jgi:hypothetical protein
MFIIYGKFSAKIWKLDLVNNAYMEEEADLTDRIHDEIVEISWIESPYIIVGCLNNKIYLFHNLEHTQTITINLLEMDILGGHHDHNA